MRQGTLVMTLLLLLGCQPQPASRSVSLDTLGVSKLKTGLSRTEAERIIAKARKQKTSYDLWAMDMSDVVEYPFPSGDVLIVSYKVGRPGKRGISGSGGAVPVDSVVLSFKVLQQDAAR